MGEKVGACFVSKAVISDHEFQVSLEPVMCLMFLRPLNLFANCYLARGTTSQ